MRAAAWSSSVLSVNMSQEIVIPRKSFDGIFTVSEFAKVLIFFFPGAVAG